jgi:acyl carrier protein
MLTRSCILARLRVIIADAAAVMPESIGLDEDLAHSGVDSLSLLRAIAEVEREFGIVIPDERFARVRTLRALADTVEDELLAKAA